MLSFMPASKVLREAVSRLQSAHIESASLDARLLLEHVLGMSREVMLAEEIRLDAPRLAAYRALIARRADRRPVSQLIGRREFWGMDFLVTEDTLDPRPDSETLIEALLSWIKSQRASQDLKILDLGTGTGCLLLSLLSELPHATGIGADISDAALTVARENARRLGLDGRATFVRSRWCERIEGCFDVIISNPPYIPSAQMMHLAPEVALYEPRLALDGGYDGLDCYREIFAALPGHLAPGGVAALEIGMGQESPVAALAEQAGLRAAGVRKDLQGIVRCMMFKPTT